MLVEELLQKSNRIIDTIECVFEQKVKTTFMSNYMSKSNNRKRKIQHFAEKSKNISDKNAANFKSISIFQ